LRRDVALGVAQQQIAEAVRLLRREDDDAARLGGRDANVGARRKQLAQLAEHTFAGGGAEERRAHVEVAERRIDVLVIAHDAQAGPKEDAGDLVDEADLVRAVDEEQLSRERPLRRVCARRGPDLRIVEIAKPHQRPRSHSASETNASLAAASTSRRASSSCATAAKLYAPRLTITPARAAARTKYDSRAGSSQR